MILLVLLVCVFCSPCLEAKTTCDLLQKTQCLAAKSICAPSPESQYVDYKVIVSRDLSTEQKDLIYSVILNKYIYEKVINLNIDNNVDFLAIIDSRTNEILGFATFRNDRVYKDTVESLFFWTFQKSRYRGVGTVLRKEFILHIKKDPTKKWIKTTVLTPGGKKLWKRLEEEISPLNHRINEFKSPGFSKTYGSLTPQEESRELIAFTGTPREGECVRFNLKLLDSETREKLGNHKILKKPVRDIDLTRVARNIRDAKTACKNLKEILDLVIEIIQFGIHEQDKNNIHQRDMQIVNTFINEVKKYGKLYVLTKLTRLLFDRPKSTIIVNNSVDSIIELLKKEYPIRINNALVGPEIREYILEEQGKNSALITNTLREIILIDIDQGEFKRYRGNEYRIRFYDAKGLIIQIPPIYYNDLNHKKPDEVLEFLEKWLDQDNIPGDLKPHEDIIRSWQKAYKHGTLAYVRKFHPDNSDWNSPPNQSTTEFHINDNPIPEPSVESNSSGEEKHKKVLVLLGNGVNYTKQEGYVIEEFSLSKLEADTQPIIIILSQEEHEAMNPLLAIIQKNMHRKHPITIISTNNKPGATIEQAV